MKKHLVGVSFLQASGLVVYIALVATFIQNAIHWFGPINSPLLPLSLLVLSALVCALISLAYPIILIWDKKQVENGIRVVIYTTLWLFLFILAFFAYLALT